MSAAAAPSSMIVGVVGSAFTATESAAIAVIYSLLISFIPDISLIIPKLLGSYEPTVPLMFLK